MKSSRRVMLATAVAAAAVVAWASPSFAHVDPDPPAVQAGTAVTVQFGVEHGCGTSPTTAVAFKVPTAITNAKGVDKVGWTTETVGGEIRFTGGRLDAATADHFDLTFTAPTAAGTVSIPVVQTCATGELAWIDVAAEGKPEPELPAPIIKVTAGPPTAADLAPADDDEAAHAHEHSDSHTGLIVGVVVGAVVAAGTAGSLVARKRRRAHSSS